MSYTLNNILSSFDPITLAGMDGVKLMNRVDKKYWIDAPNLEKVLQELPNFYYILEDEGDRSIKYKSTYYDTIDDMLYLHHHNGKQERFKVRKRNYVKSNRNYLEIKFKTSLGRTVKERIATSDNHLAFNHEDNAFIELLTQQTANNFMPRLESNFYRITLVSKTVPERVTIDIKPEFKTKEGKLKMHNLVIIEVKNDDKNHNTTMIKKLKEHGVKKAGFSKYCIGRALLDPSLKQNHFQSKIAKLVESVLVEKFPEEQLSRMAVMA